jgi:peptidase E
MIKVILHGGGVGEQRTSNDRLFAEFTNDIDKPMIKVAMCYWARPRDEWEEKCERDVELIKKQSTKVVQYALVENPNDLRINMPECDVVYVAGGDVAPIQRYVPDLDWLPKALDGKTYVGSSMGAFVASVAYVSSSDGEAIDQRRALPGFGLVPVTTLCHFNVETFKQEKINLLRLAYPKLPVVALDEFEWVRCWV